MENKIWKNIIKRDVNNSIKSVSGSNLIKRKVVDAKIEAEAIRKQAEIAANEILQRAHADAEKIKTELLSTAKEEVLAKLEVYLLEAKEIREKVWRETEKDLLKLAVRLAEKIIGITLASDDKAIVDIVATAVQNARLQEKITIRVNPQNLPILEEHVKRISSDGKIKFIDFAPDQRVSPVGCLIESQVGTIDARLETQLRILERALLSQFEGDPDSEFGK